MDWATTSQFLFAFCLLVGTLSFRFLARIAMRIADKLADKIGDKLIKRLGL
jgi:hypothetical protein